MTAGHWKGHPVRTDDSLPAGTLALSSGTETVVAMIEAGLPPHPLLCQPVVTSYPTRSDAEDAFERALAHFRSPQRHPPRGVADLW